MICGQLEVSPDLLGCFSNSRSSDPGAVIRWVRAAWAGSDLLGITLGSLCGWKCAHFLLLSFLQHVYSHQCLFTRLFRFCAPLLSLRSFLLSVCQSGCGQEQFYNLMEAKKGTVLWPAAEQHPHLVLQAPSCVTLPLLSPHQPCPWHHGVSGCGQPAGTGGV